jgi:hypothetical protein
MCNISKAQVRRCIAIIHFKDPAGESYIKDRNLLEMEFKKEVKSLFRIEVNVLRADGAFQKGGDCEFRRWPCPRSWSRSRR